MTCVVTSLAVVVEMECSEIWMLPTQTEARRGEVVTNLNDGGSLCF